MSILSGFFFLKNLNAESYSTFYSTASFTGKPRDLDYSLTFELHCTSNDVGVVKASDYELTERVLASMSLFF